MGAKQMDLSGSPFKTPDQVETLNSVLVMTMIPVYTLIVTPILDKIVFKTTASRTRKPVILIGVGLFISLLTAIVAYYLEKTIDSEYGAGTKRSIYWQFPQYVLLTTAEILISVTGLEFSYSQAPLNMKAIC